RLLALRVREPPRLPLGHRGCHPEPLQVLLIARVVPQLLSEYGELRLVLLRHGLYSRPMQCRFHPDIKARSRGLCENCYRRARRDGTIWQYAATPARNWLVQFLSNPPQTDDCIYWPFAKRDGYGVVGWDHKPQRVTRIVRTEFNAAH